MKKTEKISHFHCYLFGSLGYSSTHTHKASRVIYIKSPDSQALTVFIIPRFGAFLFLIPYYIVMFTATDSVPAVQGRVSLCATRVNANLQYIINHETIPDSFRKQNTHRAFFRGGILPVWQPSGSSGHTVRAAGSRFLRRPPFPVVRGAVDIDLDTDHRDSRCRQPPVRPVQGNARGKETERSGNKSLKL